MSKLGWVLAWCLVAVLGITYSGFTVSILWGWFVVPVFGPPVLGINQAIGLTMLIAYFSKELKTTDDREQWEKFVEYTVNAAVRPTVVLGVSWVVRQFA